ncbi:uncharacterized protein LOC114635853, partial [Grammomys surdaster]|uniref:uncharacterized protein LOC114635853 n=1 Tax=Grammomys surdaster TaxID=491861 RepID=UPI00109FBF5B
MWQPKQPGVEMKPEASGKARKRKHQNGSGTETESDALGQRTKTKRQDGTEMIFKEPGKAWKKTPPEHQDLELERDQLGKGQVQKSQEEGPRQPLEYIKGPPDQAERKPADCRKGCKHPYSALEENRQSPPKEKHERLLKHIKCVEDPHPDPHRPQPITSKMKGSVSGHSHQDQEPPTRDEREGRYSEDKSITEKEGGVKHDARRGNNLEPALPGTPAPIILDSGGGD